MNIQPKQKTPQDRLAPAWARWKAQDQDGTWYWFECRPRWNKKIGAWTTTRGLIEAVANN